MPRALAAKSEPTQPESQVQISPLAGKPAPQELLVDPAQLEREYFERLPDVEDPRQRVSFGTSGHRGSPLAGTFNEAHILAITQAICEYRRAQAIDGPLYMGKDTHGVSGPGFGANGAGQRKRDSSSCWNGDCGYLSSAWRSGVD